MSLKYNKELIIKAKALRKNQTEQERKLWYEFLSKYPVRFQRQKVIDNYIVDFYCAQAGLIIELDGGGHYQEKQVEYDSKRSEVLETYGLKILRFSNNDVNENFYGVCTVIDDYVRNVLPKTISRCITKRPPSDEGGGTQCRKE